MTSATETNRRPLSLWPADASLALVLEDDTDTFELVITTDGRAALNGRELRITEQVRVTEQRSGLAARSRRTHLTPHHANP